jgi:hypothetical protein
MSKAKDAEWVAFDCATQRYLAHPRGEWTPDVDKAHGWHYKAECLDAVKHKGHTVDVGRRGQFRSCG